MLSNMNQPAMDASIHISNTFYKTTHSHSTKNDAKEFSIYRPDVDFSVNYEPVGDTVTRLVNDAKETAATQNGENGRRAVMTTIGFNHSDPTNLHNYSKVPESVKLECNDRNNNKNVTASDPEDGTRDDNNNPSNKVDDKKPDFHLRRPMNAFLIFCKRHRALVREKYPNLENRSITKILGDWWAFLPNEDKSPYKELAKNYKDVFFSKNPNFKWYKLPAPPLRTLSTRPSNDRAMVTSPTPAVTEEVAPESTIKDRVARNVKASQQNNSGIGQFKFAAIDQMGGLTSLMSMDPASSRTNVVILCEKDIAVKIETGDSQTKKRKLDDQLELYDDLDGIAAGKSHRACKGKRYEQFMTPSKKTTKQKSTNSAVSTSVHTFPHNGYCKPQETLILKQEDSSDELSHITPSPESDETEQRNVDAADFKLNEKIMTLPSLDLDDYLNRKKAMKKKKKFTHKAKHRQQQAQAAPKDKAIPKPTVVGSQKRKAPKQTIRRTADINQPEISRELIGLETLATLALVQANGTSQ